MRALVSDLCARYREIPSLFELDDRPEGFRWIDAGNADQNVIAFVRFDGHGRPGLVCVANFSPVVHHGFRIGLPLPGRWTEAVNTDSSYYGGSGVGNLGGVDTEPVAWHVFPQSARLSLPPLGALWLSAPIA